MVASTGDLTKQLIEKVNIVCQFVDALAGWKKDKFGFFVAKY